MREYNEKMRENELVQYYLEGWRAGYFISQVGKKMKIQPIPATMKVINIPEEDVRAVEPRVARVRARRV